MSLADSIIAKALIGDENEAVIKAGTLAVTRGAGVVAAAVIATAQLEWPFDDLSSNAKLTAALASVGIWAFLAAADALARGRVVAAQQTAKNLTAPRTHVLPSPIRASIPGKPKADEDGWRVMIIRLTGGEDEKVEYWAVKGETAEWRNADEVVLS